MAVAFDAVGPSSAGASSNGSTTLSWTHTNVAAGVDVLAAVAVDDPTDAGLTASCTIGGTSATSLGRVASGAGGTSGFLQVFRRTGVGSGAQTVTITITGGTPDDMEGGSVSFTGVTAIGTPVTASSSGTSGTATASVTSVVSTSMVAGFVGCGDSVSSMSTGTSRFINSNRGGAGDATGNAAGGTNTGTGTVTTAWSLASSTVWAVLSVELQSGATAVAAPPAVAQTSRTWQRRWTRTVRPAIPPQVQSVSVHAGVATATGSAMFPPGFKPYVAGLGGTGYSSWFTDQTGAPRLMVIEQAWSLPYNAGRWNSGNWQSDMDTYFATRAAQGYTAWYGVAWGQQHQEPTSLTFGRTWDGIYPLTVNGTAGGITTGTETVALNNAFWTRIDYLFASARAQGISCFLNMGLSYDHSDTNGIWTHATNTQATAFGAALAARYPQSSYPHVFWFWGDDDDGPNDSFYQAILTGMQGAGDTRALISVEQFTNTNSHIEFDNGTAFSGTFGAPNATYNWVYSYDAPYFGCEESYTEGGTFAHIPPVYGDGVYYGDTGTGTTAARAVRTFTWWALASGSRGFPCTSGPSDIGTGPTQLWQWPSDAISRLTSDPNGTFTTSTVGAIASFFSGLADWNKLIPDTGNVFITAGRGTRGTCDGAGGVFNFRNTSTYVAGSITPGGTLAVIYCKAAMSITIDTTKMQAGYTATWVDPLSLATQSATTGSTYSSSGLGNNSAGDPDWLLVLQAPPGASPTAGIPTATGSAPAPQVVLTVTAGVATATGSAPAPRVAESPSAAVATATGTAPAPAVAETASAAVATASGVSLAPAAAVSVFPGPATATGTALVPVPAITVLAAVAVANGIALQPTVNTSGNTNAPAGVASATGSAPGPLVAITAASAVAAGTGSAPAPAAAVTLTAGVPSAAAASRAPVPALAVLPAAGTGQGIALGASVQTSSGTSANAGVATASAVALPPSRAITVAAAAAAAQALAVTVPPPFTIGQLTASVASGGAGGTLTASDQRTGGPS